MQCAHSFPFFFLWFIRFFVDFNGFIEFLGWRSLGNSMGRIKWINTNYMKFVQLAFVENWIFNRKEDLREAIYYLIPFNFISQSFEGPRCVFMTFQVEIHQVLLTIRCNLHLKWRVSWPKKSNFNENLHSNWKVSQIQALIVEIRLTKNVSR